MQLFGLKACDTCRKAIRELSDAGVKATLTDIRAVPLPRAEIERFLAAFGDALVNRRSTTWRGLSEAERARPPVDLLADHPALMKRPVIVHQGGLTLGWDAAARAKLLG